MKANKEIPFKVRQYVWSGVNPTTNNHEVSLKTPSEEQRFWRGFEFNNEDYYECYCAYFEYNPIHKIEGFRVFCRALGNWEKDYIQTEKEVTDIINDITSCTLFIDLQTMLILHGFVNY